MKLMREKSMFKKSLMVVGNVGLSSVALYLLIIMLSYFSKNSSLAGLASVPLAANYLVFFMTPALIYKCWDLNKKYGRSELSKIPVLFAVIWLSELVLKVLRWLACVGGCSGFAHEAAQGFDMFSGSVFLLVNITLIAAMLLFYMLGIKSGNRK